MSLTELLKSHFKRRNVEIGAILIKIDNANENKLPL